MSTGINEIQIAGAGAGKTYGLSKRLIERYNSMENNKTFYAITFTNSARKNIQRRVLEELGSIPHNMNITTIHGFLLNEVIYPFSKFIEGKYYSKAVSIELSNNLKFKQYKLKKLNEENIIHNEQVFKKAQMILNKDRKNKKIKRKIDIIMHHIEDSIDCILIDEAQDMDKDAIKVFTILSNLKIYIYMVGDPKQAIRYNGVFKEFCDEVREGEKYNYTMLENLNITKRVPEKHLKISNMFCSLEEVQKNEYGFKGELSYMFHSQSEFNSVFERVINENGLIYISKSNTRFNTQKSTNKVMIPSSIQIKLKNINIKSELSFDVWIDAVIDKLHNLVKDKGINKALKIFQEGSNIELSRQEYAELKEIFQPRINDTKKRYEVISIDRAKGLESNLCVFIIDNAQFQYIMGYKDEKNKEFNKLYIALTRSKNELILVFDDYHIKDIDKVNVDKYMNKLQIEKHQI